MKAIIFDNAGTILQRKTILKDMSDGNLFSYTDTIGIANKNINRIIVVFQTPVSQLDEYKEMSIKEYMLLHKQSFKIAYSQRSIQNNDLLKIISDNVYINDILETSHLLLKENVEIVSGAAIIVDVSSGDIEYVYTAGGSFFKYTSDVMNYLKKQDFEIYIASGDNKISLNEVSSILNIPKNNIYSTCNVDCKERVVEKLQSEGYYVYMVGNHTNDRLAIKKADVGILTIQQKELLPKKLVCAADYVISSIDMVLDVIEKENNSE